MDEARKPVGGVRRVRLISPSDLKEVTLLGEECSSLLLKEGATPLDLPLREGQSHYREEWSLLGGIPTVEHTLELGLECLFEEQIERSALISLLEQGVVALVEMMDGEARLVGWSPRLKGEAPLCPQFFREESGTRRQDLPTAHLILSARDDSMAIVLTNFENCITYEET